MNSDFKDLLRTFEKEGVEYLVVGAYAVIHYTQPRYTKDIDLWIRPTKANAQRVGRAFHEFGIPLIEVQEEDFAHDGLQYVIGMPPSQIDFLTSLPGLASFEAAWAQKSELVLGDFTIHVLGKSHLIAAKENAGRPQDLADLDELRRAGESEEES